ncbi:hypothetical protein [Hydrogenophaga sp.]|uniref:hypothetical protein n=1 Tax=Hydrogenophaga sp. TaxID=1904254 RepID=UPI003563FA48
MYPWLIFWAPQVHFPWSGNVSQDIDPTTHWFSQMIQPGAGDARIEQKAFAVASYGKQLGQLTEVLIAVAEQSPDLSPEARKALDSLRHIRAEIENIKQDEYQHSVARLVEEVQAVQNRGGAEYQKLTQMLLPVLGRSAP